MIDSCGIRRRDSSIPKAKSVDQSYPTSAECVFLYAGLVTYFARKTVEFCAMQPLLPLQLSRTLGQGLPATSNMSGVYYSSSATVVRPGAGDLAKLSYHKSDRGDNILFSQLSEVKEACEFEESSGTALSQVKGSLRRHVEFWRSIQGWIQSSSSDLQKSLKFLPNLISQLFMAVHEINYSSCFIVYYEIKQRRNYSFDHTANPASCRANWTSLRSRGFVLCRYFREQREKYSKARSDKVST